ncbi:MAG: amidophosphoribosyltransferase [Planctomycetes bacterium]|nr:amidophosphoribosyltransferase [Planctomycetota bacterium]
MSDDIDTTIPPLIVRDVFPPEESLSVLRGVKFEGPREACGLFGAYGLRNAHELVFVGIFQQQHRGQESCGIVSSVDNDLATLLRIGTVGEQITPDKMAPLKSEMSIGHVRYSTQGSPTVKNTQPLVVETHRYGPIAVAHNGNLTNALELRREAGMKGAIFQTTNDTEVILHLVARSEQRDIVDAIRESLERVEGAYSLLFLTPRKMIAVRDPRGFRPLSIARLDNGWVVASESCAFDQIGAVFQRDVEPGEVIVFDDPDSHRFKTLRLSKVENPSFCFFEHVYFARPDSKVFGDFVYESRLKMGRQLAREHPIEADIVSPVPDSGTFAAQGYAHESGIAYHDVFIRNHYVGRTFLKPSDEGRKLSIDMKLNVIKNVVRDKRIVVVDDSIIRGNTAKRRVTALKQAGAREVHLRISCPPTVAPCYFGVDFPNAKDLIAAKLGTEEIKKELQVDSLGYLSLEGMLGCASLPKTSYCTGCWTGKHPVKVVGGIDKHASERKGRTTSHVTTV